MVLPQCISFPFPLPTLHIISCLHHILLHNNISNRYLFKFRISERSSLFVEIQWSVRNGSDMSLQCAQLNDETQKTFIINDIKGKFSSNKHFIHYWFQENRPPGSKDKSLDLFLHIPYLSTHSPRIPHISPQAQRIFER